MTVYRHWTAAERVPQILGSGFIAPTESNLDLIIPNAGPPVVWLLPPEVDPGTGDQHGLSDLKRTGWIDVDVPAIRWLDWELTADMDPDWKRGMIAVAGGQEAAEQWYVWPGPIYSRRFVGSSEGASA